MKNRLAMEDAAIRRMDGAAPYNGYLWPLDDDWFWARDDVAKNISGRWNFSVVGLADGRWSTSGSLYDIEKGETCFDSRGDALRSSGALLIRTIRNARFWVGAYDRLSPELAQTLIDWVRLTIARESQTNPTRAIQLLTVERPQPVGLPILDFINGVPASRDRTL